MAWESVSILALLLAAQAPARIASEAIDESRYRLSIEAAGIATMDRAQAALLPTARRLCGRRPVTFGTFRYVQSETSKAGAKALQSLSFEQELVCGAARTSVDPAALPTGNWQPSPADQQAVLAASYAYFAAKDQGRYPEAWAMLSKSMKGATPAAAWARTAGDFRGRAGPVRSRRVTEITWYNNPPEAREPGLYVAADFSAEFEQLEFLCGYVMWRLQPDGKFVLMREEQNLLDKATAKRLASIDRQPLRAQMGCKD